MKFFTLLLALSAAFYTCFAASSAFAQSAPEALLAESTKDSSQPNVSVIEIESNPEVIVLIDNERIGATPVSIAIEPGKHEFELINTENDIHIHKLFEVEAGKQASFNFNFDMECKHNESAIPKVLLNFLSPALVQKKSAKEKETDIQNAKELKRRSPKKADKHSDRIVDSKIAIPF